MTPDEMDWFVPHLEVFTCSFVLVLFAGKSVFKSYPRLSIIQTNSSHRDGDQLYIHHMDIKSTPFQPPMQSDAQFTQQQSTQHEILARAAYL